MSNQNIYWQLLQKEMDIIEGTVRNLDDIIYKTKYFAFTVWGGSIFLIAQHLTNLGDHRFVLYLLTAIIPLLFWIMNYEWSKHLMTCRERKRIIAAFVNGPDFKQLILEGKELAEKEQFPFYDPVGWIYITKNYPSGPFAMDYLVDKIKFKWHHITFYKDSGLFYGTLTLLSIAFGIFYYLSKHGC